jgi:hypothetical protein
MAAGFKLLPGLPPYGPAARAFPSEWGRLGREGIVVAFESEAGSWVGNFRPGVGGLNVLYPHPNNRDAVVIASGDLWVVSPDHRSAEFLLSAIDRVLEAQDPSGWVLSRQGIALARLGPSGLMWHTRQLSWDGFDELRIAGNEVTGLGWSPIGDKWLPFRVDLHTGKSSGGAYAESNADRWEVIL